MINFSKIKEYPLDNITIGVNGTIKEAIKTYSDNKVNHNALIEDYLNLMQYDDSQASNPWTHITRKVTGISPYTGCTASETAFIFGAMALKKQRPTDVINSLLFANKVRNDSMLEYSLVFKEFIQNILPEERILIVNPCPTIIEHLESHEPDIALNTIYAIPNERIAALFNGQYNCSRFVSTYALSSCGKFQHILLITRDTPIEYLNLDAVFDCCDEHGDIDAIIPAELLGKAKYGFRDQLTDHNCYIPYIARVPSELSMSTPRKKLIIGIVKSPVPSIKLFDIQFTVKKELVSSVAQPNPIPYSVMQYGMKTINEMYSYVEEENSNSVRNKYQSASLYDFSKEIKISYTIYPHRKGKLSASAYYAKIKDIEHPQKRGKRQTNIIEKGLRGDSITEVEDKFLNLAFDERLYYSIVEDINSNYLGIAPLSLKTLWYCCHASLINMKTYEDSIAIHLFMSKSQILSDIIPEKTSGLTIVDKMAELIQCDPELIPFEYFNTINLILNQSVKKGYIFYNPLAEFVPEFTNRETARQHEVVNALVYKAFTQKQEDMLIQQAISCQNHSNEKLHILFVRRSIYLSPLIRLFTGMQNREVCALTWSDIELNVHGFSYFKVSKFVDQNGKIVSHILREDLKRFRSIPICRFLQHALDLRYHYLLSHGISKETLSKSPIILSNESIASMQSGQIPHFCNPITSSEICKKISKQVRVEEKWIILPDADKETHLDVYKYHGDIYTSTFKNRLETICSMPENDIRYLVGNEPLNTLSRHYEAFDHPDILNMLFIGIERWASQYLPYFGKTKFGEISDSKELTDSTTIGPYRQGVSSTEICVNNNKKNYGETLSLEVDADYGYEIEIQFFD